MAIALIVNSLTFLVFSNKIDSNVTEIEQKVRQLEEDIITIQIKTDGLNQRLMEMNKKLDLIIEEQNSFIDKVESNKFSEQEIKYLQKCIETETYQADFDAKVNVANVLLNRINHEKFPNDAISVVTQKNQFAYGRDNISEDTKEALIYAMNNADTTNGAIGFNSFENVKKTWNNWKYIMTDKSGHHFYVMKG